MSFAGCAWGRGPSITQTQVDTINVINMILKLRIQIVRRFRKKRSDKTLKLN